MLLIYIYKYILCILKYRISFLISNYSLNIKRDDLFHSEKIIIPIKYLYRYSENIYPYFCEHIILCSLFFISTDSQTSKTFENFLTNYLHNVKK